MNDLNKRQTASVRSFKKVDEKEKHFVYMTFENCNAVTRVLTVDHRYGRVLGPCRPGMAACSRSVVRDMHSTRWRVYS